MNTNRGRLIGSLIVLLATCAGASTSVPRKNEKAEPILALSLPDARLDAAVQCSQHTGPLLDYANSLAQAAKLPLEVQPDLQPVRVSVFNGKSAPRKLLRELEWVVAATWTAPEGKAPYRLERTKKDLDRIVSARAKQQRSGRAALQRRWDQVRRWAFLSGSQLNELAKADPGMAKVMQFPREVNGQRLGFSLPSSVYSALWQRGIVRIPISQLSPQLQQLAVQSCDLRQVNAEQLLSGGILKLEIGGPPDRQTVWMTVRTRQDGHQQNLLFAEGWTRQPPVQRRDAIRAHPTPVPDGPLFKKKVSIRDPASPRSETVDERPTSALPLLPLVEQVARQVNVPVIVLCDYRPRPEEVREHRNNPRKDRMWLSGQGWLADEILEQPLAQALDLLCADFQYEWTYRSGAILLRHRRWFLPEEERDFGKRLQKDFPS